MKKIVLSLTLSFAFFGFSGIAQSRNPNLVVATIDLKNVIDDKVMVVMTTPKIKNEKIVFNIPKTVPGTYSEDNFGQFIEDFKALNARGELLPVTKLNTNSWEISDAKKLSKITYLVNDTFDQEKGGQFGTDIFSPTGTNIDDGKNFMINTHGFVGYFDEFNATPYQLNVLHAATLWGATSMTDTNPSKIKDTFTTNRYATLVENPIMYATPDYTTFNVNGMDILIALYSPNGTFKAEDISAQMKTTMTAQKNFLGSFNSTKKYSVLIYLSDMKIADAKGFGALEHPTATTVVMPEMMPKDQLAEQLKDVVSHEFFHIVTPLNIHSKEIQDFDYINPKMSQHLWMYEGVTEYFANLFQVNQGLITEDEFYARMAGKIENSKGMNDTMSFTTMSANVLVEPYKGQYLNVYEKGALIGMCIDIIIREKSNGERGILDMMQKLAVAFGENKAFDDNELFGKITELTYPEVGAFLKTYVEGTAPIPYADYFLKMGVFNTKTRTSGNVFIKGQTPYISVNRETKEIFVLPGIDLNVFYTNLGIKNGDVILEVNGIKYNVENIYDLIMTSQKWKDGEAITLKIKSDGKEHAIAGKIKIPFEEKEGFSASDETKRALKEAWLKK